MIVEFHIATTKSANQNTDLISAGSVLTAVDSHIKHCLLILLKCVKAQVTGRISYLFNRSKNILNIEHIFGISIKGGLLNSLSMNI